MISNSDIVNCFYKLLTDDDKEVFRIFVKNVNKLRLSDIRVGKSKLFNFNGEKIKANKGSLVCVPSLGWFQSRFFNECIKDVAKRFSFLSTENELACMIYDERRLVYFQTEDVCRALFIGLIDRWWLDGLISVDDKNRLIRDMDQSFIQRRKPKVGNFIQNLFVHMLKRNNINAECNVNGVDVLIDGKLKTSVKNTPAEKINDFEDSDVFFFVKKYNSKQDVRKKIFDLGKIVILLDDEEREKLNIYYNNGIFNLDEGIKLIKEKLNEY